MPNKNVVAGKKMSATKITLSGEESADWPKRAEVTFVGQLQGSSLRVAFETSEGSVTAAYVNRDDANNEIRALMLRANAIMAEIRSPRFGERSMLFPVVVQERRRAAERRQSEIRAGPSALAAAFASGATLAGGAAMLYALRDRAQARGTSSVSVATEIDDELEESAPPTLDDRIMRAILVAVLLKLAAEWTGYAKRRVGDAEAVIIDRAGIRCLLATPSVYVFTSARRLPVGSLETEALDGQNKILAKLGAWDDSEEDHGGIELAYADPTAWCFVRSKAGKIVDLLFTPPTAKELGELTGLDDFVTVCRKALPLACDVAPTNVESPAELVLSVRMLVFRTLVDSMRRPEETPVWSADHSALAPYPRELTWSAQIGDQLVVTRQGHSDRVPLEAIALTSSDETVRAVKRTLSSDMAAALRKKVPINYPMFVTLELDPNVSETCEKCNSRKHVMHVMLPCGHVLCEACADACGCGELYTRSKRHRKCARNGCGCGERNCTQCPDEKVRCVCPWSRDPRMCTAQLATPSKLIRAKTLHSSRHHQVPLSAIRERWSAIAATWPTVREEQHQDALAAIDIALAYPAFLRSFRYAGRAPERKVVRLYFPDYSATVKVDVEGGSDGKPARCRVDKHGVWRASYERDGVKTELARAEAPCGMIWSKDGGLEHPRLAHYDEAAWTTMSWRRIMCLCREVDRYTPLFYRFALKLRDNLIDQGGLLITSPGDATVTLRKPMSKGELELRVGSVLRTRQKSSSDTSGPDDLLKVAGINVKEGKLLSIVLHRWSWINSMWRKGPGEIPMLEPTASEIHKKPEWLWDWQRAELALEPTPDLAFGRRFV